MSGRIKTFYRWAIENYEHYRHSGVYDLISDMIADKECFPRSSEYGINKQYLEDNNACSNCMCCFENAWSDYYLETRGELWSSSDDNSEEDYDG